jgi:hypothetical protein
MPGLMSYIKLTYKPDLNVLQKRIIDLKICRPKTTHT